MCFTPNLLASFALLHLWVTNGKIVMPQSSTGSIDHTYVVNLQSSSFQVIWLYAFHTKKYSVVQLEKVWRSTITMSIRYHDNSAKIFVPAVTKLLSSTTKIAYADHKLSFLDIVNNSSVTYHIIGNQ